MSEDDTLHDLCKSLATSSITERLQTLSSLSGLVGSSPIEDLNTISLRLLKTFNYYQDAKSRTLVTKLLCQLISINHDFLAKYTKFILGYATMEKSMLITSLLTLFEWTNEFLILETTTDLIQAQALLLEKCLDYSMGLEENNSNNNNNIDTILPPVRFSQTDKQHKRRVRESCLSQVRASIITCIDKDLKLCDLYVEYLTMAKISVSAKLSLFGLLADSAEESIPKNPAFYETLKLHKDEIIQFFNKEALSSKKLQQYSLILFKSFVSKFITLQDVEQILPALEKSSLRSSELTFGHITPVFFDALDGFELSLVLCQSKFITLLISSIKATKGSTRLGAVSTLESIVSKNCNNANDEDVLTIVDELFKSLKSVSSLDIKKLYGNILAKIPVSERVSNKICDLLITLIVKDQNEISLRSYLDSFFVHYDSIIYNDWPQLSTLQDSIFKGFQEKKQNLKKIWFLSMGDCLLRFTKFNSSMLNFIRKLIPLMISALEETLTNPLQMITAKGIESAYVTLAVSKHLLKYAHVDQELVTLITGEDIFAKLLINDEENKKPSIISNSKVFTKINTDDEKNWFEKATFACIDNLDDGDVLLFLTLSNSISADLRRVALKDLHTVLHSNGETQKLIGDLVILSLWKYLKNSYDDGKFEFDLKNIPQLVNVLTQSGTDIDITTKHIGDLLVVCHAINTKGGWVGVAQRAKVDPGMVVEKFGDEIFKQLANSLLETDTKIYDKIIESLCTIAFISPVKISPLLCEIIKNDITSGRVSSLDETSFLIWRASDDNSEPVVDVLSNSKKNNQISKNSKDYETRKWEESVRNDLSKKKSRAGKKLTKEEQSLVNQQLETEKEIRLSLKQNYNHLFRGISIVKGLSKEINIENGRDKWFPISVNSLLDILKFKNTKLFLGELPALTFLLLSNLLTPRLGNSRLFLGVATLRSLGVEVDESLSQEPISELISRVLYKVKFLSVQRPLDNISLIYILPLLIDVLQKGKLVAIRNSKNPVVKSEFVDEDPEEEKLILAMEITSSHAEEFQDDSIPRHDILEVLLSLLALPAKLKLAKECLSMMCQQISVNISASDLSLIMAGCIKPEAFVRTTILEIIDAEFELTYMPYSNEIWIAVHDNNTTNAELAATIWEENKFKLDESSPHQLIGFLNTHDGGIRLSVSKAIASAVTHLSQSNEDIFEKVLDELLLLYDSKAKPPPPILDQFGLVIKTSTDQRDPWEERSGVALTLKHLAHLFKTETSINKLFNFLTEEQALGDKESIVRQELQEAGVEIINQNGFHYIETLIPIFEKVLSAKDEGSKIQDTIRESVIILYGSLARHLESSDERLKRVVDRLIKTLDTPSEDVQFAVSECIAPLVKLFDPHSYFDDLFKKLFESQSLASRRGAAYGIAGLVKGVGISALANYDIMRNLMEASEDKKDAKRREGVSFAIECLSQSLGKYFEPYVIEVLPIILKQLGDSNAEVREATDYATRVIMKNTTSYGVKQLIPLAIQNLDEILWRTKRGSVDLLGSMAYLDPTQLSSSLSTIIPEIVSVLNDSHKEVRKSADLALKRFGEVIRNPEIQSLVPTLIKAIGDPTKYTDDALDALIKTQFVHYIDGPSLALIIHVIHRGMHDRSASTKRKACQIVGNMSILVDSKDLMPYLPELVSELEISMVDPVPATRATAARALGSLVEKLGEDQFPDLIPRLLRTLQDEERAGDRLGSAQALSEIISALGTSKLEEMLPTILSNASNARPYVRAGFMPLLLFLPVCFGMQFSIYLDRVIPVILEGLAAEEDIRETALKAARLIVKNYSTKAVDLLLPELERGLSDLSYRIRLSSVELTGELLFQITGITGKLDLSDSSEQVEYSGIGQTLIQVLGQERRDRVLASLFVCRQDVSGLVRNATVDIWKALVANTPKTVKEILPTLTSIIIRRLASADETQRSIAAQTLGELVRRVGGNALPSLLPTLEEQLVSSDSDAKQGICIAIRELIESSPIEIVKEYQPAFVNIVRDALVDSNESVREAAASAFDILQDVIGDVAVDEIIPQLLNKLNSGDSENALLALQDIMSTKSDVIFPILIPSLISPRIDAFKARALASLAEVAGSALYKRLSTIINAFVSRLLEKDANDGELDEIKKSFDDVLLSVNNDEGLHPLLQQLLALIKNEDSKKRAIIFERLAPFFKNTHLDYSIYTQDIVSHCIMTLDDEDPAVVVSAFNALNELVSRQSKESLEKLVKPARQSLSITGIAGTDLAGFTLPKGPNCILPIFLHGLMYGNAEQREASALGIADIVEKTPATNLKPFVTVIVGPLIRVIGERYSGDVKAAILYALNMLFAKIPQFLRPFIPQLQRTFVKSLSDASNETLRSRAAKALGTLIEFQPRVDPLVAELVGGAKQATDGGVRTAMLKALLEVVNKAGSKMNESSKNSVMNLVEEEMSNADEKMAVAYARLVGSLSKILTHDELIKVLRAKVLDSDLSGDSGKFAVLTLNAFLRDSPSHIFETGLTEEIGEFIKSCCEYSSAYVSDNGVIAAGKFLLLQNDMKSPFSNESETPFEISTETIEKIIKTLTISMAKPASNSLDTRRLTLVLIKTVARFKFEEIIKPYVNILAPSIFACVRDVIIPIKLAAEKAFLGLFNLVEDEKMIFFNNWFNSLTGTTVVTLTGQTIQVRSIGDYTKRVAIRLANVERERIAAGGDEETMFSDRYEDETEIWAVGGVDLGSQ